MAQRPTTRSTTKRKPAAVTSPKKAPAAKANPAKGGNVSGVHVLREDNPWAIDYAGHEPRSDSPLYVQSRQLMNAIAKATQAGSGPHWFYGDPDWEDHHGGGLWVHDGKGWFFLKNLAGMEWASQFCADPAKIDHLRENANRLYQGSFRDNTKQQMLQLSPGYRFEEILTTPIKDAAGMAQWTDSIFNASVPLPKPRHTGVAPGGHGIHHYPTPVTDIELFKHDDFVLWVKDDEGKPAAVVPVHPRGVDPNDPQYKANYSKTAVAYATPGTALATKLAAAHKRGNTLLASATSKLTTQAFKQQ
jgi:hypothetical protein